MTPSHGRIETLQALRAIGAIIIVFVHAHGGVAEASKQGIADAFLLSHENILMLGGFGVDFFFVISGFIMTTVVWNNFRHDPQPLRFAEKRFVRVFPIYWFHLSIWVAFYLLIARHVPGMPVVTTNDIALSYLLVPTAPLSVAGAYASISPLYYNVLLPVSWTLSFEIYFYIIVMLCLPFSRKFFIPIVFAIFTAGTLLLSGMASTSSLFWLMSDPMLYEFLFGIITGFIVHKGIRIRNGAAWFMLAAGLFIAYSVPFHPFPFVRCLSWGIPATLVVLAVVTLENNRAIRVPRWLSSLGDGSYSLYLSHLLVILFLEQIFTGIGAWSIVGGNGFVLIATLASIVIGQLSYLFIEKKTLGLLSRKSSRSASSSVSVSEKAADFR